MTAHLRSAVESVAADHGLDPDLVEAIVLTESGGNPYAIRYEPRYRYLVNVRTRQPFRSLSRDEVTAAVAPADFPAMALVSRDTEWTQQRTSWGLMQIMGAVAREHGYREPFLSALCDPMTGLKYGCRYLAGLLAWAKGDVERGVRAYNGGPGGADLPVTSDYWRKVSGHLAVVRGR